VDALQLTLLSRGSTCSVDWQWSDMVHIDHATTLLQILYTCIGCDYCCTLLAWCVDGGTAAIGEATALQQLRYVAVTLSRHAEAADHVALYFIYIFLFLMMLYKTMCAAFAGTKLSFSPIFYMKTLAASCAQKGRSALDAAWQL
jgi:hypothetical protein